MENWEIVQRNKETGEKKTFGHAEWNTSKETAQRGAELRRMLVSDKYDVFIRQIPPVTLKMFESPYTLKSRKSEIDGTSRPKGKRFDAKLVVVDDVQNEALAKMKGN